MPAPVSILFKFVFHASSFFSQAEKTVKKIKKTLVKNIFYSVSLKSCDLGRSISARKKRSRNAMKREVAA
jgi:hypothetical protein